MVHNFNFYDASVKSFLRFSYDYVDVDLNDVLRALDSVLYMALESRSSFIITKSLLNDEQIFNIVLNFSDEEFHKVVHLCDNFLSLRGLELVI